MIRSAGRTLWDLESQKMDLPSHIRNYKTLEWLSNKIDQKTNLSINLDDKTVLRNFLENRQMTLGDILTLNNLEGSRIISSLEKLVNFGLVRRDWNKEVEMHTDVVYSITPEGHYIATSKV